MISYILYSYSNSNLGPILPFQRY